MTVTEGEIEGKCLPGKQRKDTLINDVRRCTAGGLPDDKRKAFDGL